MLQSSNIAHEIKKDMPEPKTLLGAWKEMLETWKIQKSDPDYAFDTIIPESSKNTAKMPSEAQSIGDLAPKGLG